MAKRVVTITEYTDDMTGGKAEGTVSFAFAGHSYEIDLSRANTRAFEKAVAPYVNAARKVRGSRVKAVRTAPAKHDLSAVREWAKNNGYSVSERGRVASAVIEAYESAM